MANNENDLINLLIEERKKLKLTQNKLSIKADLSHTTIARIENKEMSPTLKTFILMANQLGYDLVLQKLDTNESDTKESKFRMAAESAGYEIINNNILANDVLVLKKSIRK